MEEFVAANTKFPGAVTNGQELAFVTFRCVHTSAMGDVALCESILATASTPSLHPTDTRPAIPKPSPTPIVGLVQATTLNVRSGPGTNQEIISKLKKGDSVTVVSRSADGSWLEILTSGGVKGWVSSEYVEQTRAALARATAKPTARPSSPTPAGERSPVADRWVAYQLASLDKGYLVEQDDITIAQFSYLLQSIAAKTSNSQQDIADILVRGQELLQNNHGMDISLLELAAVGEGAIPAGAEVDFAEIMAAMIVLMTR